MFRMLIIGRRFFSKDFAAFMQQHGKYKPSRI
jgi:hypothetical protein